MLNNYLEYKANNRFISSYRDPMLITAPFVLQENFSDIISLYNIKIFNQKSSYTIMPENNDIIEAGYSLSLEGNYISLLKYLIHLNENNMFYRLDSLKLKIQKNNSLYISLQLRSLYESKNN
ncbi:MAG: hypothetical protein HRU35_00505 [Rickettsiaceae bacterium]|nr:hypothetical protein [Rickettsiaceae bacterium]